MTDNQLDSTNGRGDKYTQSSASEEFELPLDALHLQRSPSLDAKDLHASLDLVSHTQRTGARGHQDGLTSRGRVIGFEDSFDDSMSYLGESFAVDDRDEPRRANPNTYKQLEAIQDMTEEEDEEECSTSSSGNDDAAAGDDDEVRLSSSQSAPEGDQTVGVLSKDAVAAGGDLNFP
ncbi:hypothetical protein MPSEU_000731200 [Mayamaea pseudoterrestris]|nr:hypothetical protein MPSEU_000731200 [Mayamaea pseudoterrestris]